MSKSLEKAKAEAAKQNPGVVVREGKYVTKHNGIHTERDALIYSWKGKDLIARMGGAYAVLMDFPAIMGNGYKIGATKHLAEPFDEQCAYTVRDLVAAIEQ